MECLVSIQSGNVFSLVQISNRISISSSQPNVRRADIDAAIDGIAVEDQQRHSTVGQWL